MNYNFPYKYAEIELDTGLCVGVQTRSKALDTTRYPMMIPIPVYDEDYIDKYYINGNWYEDAEGTIPWTSSLL